MLELINSENQKLVKSDFLNHVIEELKNFSINSFYQGDFFLGELLTEKTVAEFDQKLNDFLFHDNLFADAQKLYLEKLKLKSENDLPKFLKSKKDFIKNASVALTFLNSKINGLPTPQFEKEQQLLELSKFIESEGDKQFLKDLFSKLEKSLDMDLRLATKLYYDWEMKKFRLIDLDHYDSRVYKGNQIKLVNLSITVINSPKSPERFDVVIPKTFLSLLNFEDENSKLIFLLKKLVEEWIDRIKDFIFNQLEDRFYSKSIIELIQDGYPILLLNDEFLSSRADGFMKTLPVLNGLASKEEKKIVRSVILSYVDKTLNLE